jgi:hypothetical protein
MCALPQRATRFIRCDMRIVWMRDDVGRIFLIFAIAVFLACCKDAETAKAAPPHSSAPVAREFVVSDDPDAASLLFSEAKYNEQLASHYAEAGFESMS